MNIAFYEGAAGLMATQSKLNVVGGNVANSNTVGYKPATDTFEDLLHYKMYVHSTPEPLQGTGSRDVATGMIMNQGALLTTSRDLDYALAGDGFFAVDNNGSVAYTRCGSFSAASNGAGQYYLADASGRHVLNTQGNPILLQKDAQTGRFADVSSQIGVFTFNNPEVLTQLSDNLYAANTGTGAPTAVAAPQIRNGAVEQSATSTADEMTNMIIAQRSYQLSARVLQTASEIEDTVNSLRS